MNRPVQYLTYVEDTFSTQETDGLEQLLKENGLAGTEVFMNYEGNRSQSLLFDSEAKKAAVIEKYKRLCVKRIHCSYWSYPTSFLNKLHYRELVQRQDGEEGICRYYGDLTGDHMFARWTQEYELACALGCLLYTSRCV